MQLEQFAELWDHVRDNCPAYNPKILVRYAPNSKEVYGEVNPKLVNEFIRQVGLTSDDIFFDLGSGVGNVVLQVAAQTGCEAHGVEIRPELHNIALSIKDYCAGSTGGQDFSRAHFVNGDVSNPSIDITSATVVYVNNFCFPEQLQQLVLEKFKRGLRDGTRVISLKTFSPRFRPNRYGPPPPNLLQMHFSKQNRTNVVSHSPPP